MDMLERIQTECERKHYTFKSLEEECGLGNGTIRRWSISSPSVDKVLKIANVLHVSVGYLIAGEENSFEPADNQEWKLLKNFRELTPRDQKEVISIINMKLDTYDDFMGRSSPWRNGSNGIDEDDGNGIA